MNASRQNRRRPARQPLVGRTPAGRRQTARHAFTLLELLLVLAILVVLAGFVAVNVVGTQQGANVDATTAQLTDLKNRIKQYQLRMNSIPQTLEELRDGPSDAAKKAKWVGSIIEEIPKDAWGNDLDYKVNGNGYELRSAGVDGQMSTEDDIVVNS
jgi:general secretion pathway protein G